jgi:hypothetical protein
MNATGTSGGNAGGKSIFPQAVERSGKYLKVNGEPGGIRTRGPLIKSKVRTAEYCGFCHQFLPRSLKDFRGSQRKVATP